MLNKEVIIDQSHLYNSFYLYDERKIIESMSILTENFKNIQFLYSVKCNSNANVVNCILSNNFGVDAASANEVLMGVKNGVTKQNIQYSAPGKNKRCIQQTIDNSTLIADSFNEILLIEEVARENGVRVKIGVRLNPEFTFNGDQGVPSKFGIDQDLFFDNIPTLLELKNIEIVGLHIHIKSQELDENILADYYKKLLNLADLMQIRLNRSLEFVNMGSGIGIDYEEQSQPIDIESLGRMTENLLNIFAKKYPKTQIYIETGRYIVGKNGIYVTKILDKKMSHGKTFVILSNTLNGFIRPSLAQLVNAYSSNQNSQGTEPLYTSKNPSKVIVLNNSEKLEKVTLVGNLCTSADVVATDMLLPKLEIGDVLAFTNAGSYAAVLSPMQFSSQTPPKELFLSKNGDILI